MLCSINLPNLVFHVREKRNISNVRISAMKNKLKEVLEEEEEHLMHGKKKKNDS